MSAPYLSIADALRDEIASKRLPPHSRLPSEQELVQRYKVARETVRKALAKLEQDGLVYRRRAVGTFVAEPRVDQALDQLFSFTEFMTYRGLQPGSVLLKGEIRRIRDPQSPVLQQLGLKPGARVIHLRRLRTGSGEPLVIASTWLPASRFSTFLKHDLRRHSVYEIMGRMGLRPTDAIQTITAVTLDREQAQLLDVPVGTAALMIQRLAFSNGLPVEFAIDHYRADRTTFRVRLGILEQRFGQHLHAEHLSL
jgi:GntR family transcriptional regulator, N-acetylglucosamine utilization regulator